MKSEFARREMQTAAQGRDFDSEFSKRAILHLDFISSGVDKARLRI